MWMNHEMLKEDLEKLLACKSIEWEKFRKKTFLITGATGVIGFNLICGLIYANMQKKLDLKILALVRDYEKAVTMYKEQNTDNECLKFISGDVTKLPEIDENINYVIHTACPTTSSYFIQKPVETIKTSVVGTMNVLELAGKKKAEGVIFTSSMEVYGATENEAILKEENLGYMDTRQIRNCYPESKRLCENLCAAYTSEYQIPVMVVRLAQTFGLGIDKKDSRVFAEFARCVLEKRDIELLTDGSSKRCYLYTMDAVSAILTVLTKGKAGAVYNVGNPSTYCSVKEMAEMVAVNLGQGQMKVKILMDTEESQKFSPHHFYNLGIDRMKELGWKPEKGLREMYQRMIQSF